MRDVDLTATPRVVTQQHPLTLHDVDGGHCGAEGIRLFKGPHYYQYENAKTLVDSTAAPEAQKITSAMLGCQD